MNAIPPSVPRLRSALFVPGYRRDFMEKVASTGADGIILDLEDSVPIMRREEARTTIRKWIAEDRSAGPTVCVRINTLDQGCLEEDLAAAFAPSLVAILIPKIQGAGDIRDVETAVARHEARIGLAPLTVRLWPLLETARAVHDSYEIATSSKRIAYMGVGGSANGDLARDIGLQSSPTFLETLYIRSKVLLDVRAAEMPNPMAGAISTIRDTALVESYARFMRRLGYDGMVAIHPSQVAIANQVFGPTEEQVAAARELVAAMAAAERDGQGAIMHHGVMIDAAHLQSARAVIAEMDAIEQRRALEARR